VATNTGSGYLDITAQGDVIGESGDGIRASNGYVDGGTAYGTNLTILAEGTVTGDVDGIDATNVGTGDLSITTENAVIGAAGDGIRASGGRSGDAVEILAQAAVTGGLDGIDAANSGGGALDITTQGVVTGQAGTGIRASNGFNDLGNATFAGTTLTITAEDDVLGIGGDGIFASNLGSGPLTVTAQALVRGTSGSGIETFQRDGGNTVITVAGTATVEGSTSAIDAEGEAGEGIAITNTGTLRNITGAIDALVVETTGGETTLLNGNLMTGRLALGAFDDVVTNGGTWTTNGESNFGAGADELVNTGTLVIGNQAGVSQSASFLSVDLMRNSGGIIDLSDETAGNGSTSFDTLTIAGDFEGVSGTLQLDAFLGGAGSQADTLVITGTASGTTGITIVNTNAGTADAGANILLVDTGGSFGSEFVLASGPIRVGSFVYDLIWDGEDFFLQSTLDALLLDSPVFTAALGDLWQITASGWHQNTLRLQGAANAGAIASRSATDPSQRVSLGVAGGSGALGWGTLIIDQRNSDGVISSGTSTDVSFDQTTRAMIGGVDFIRAPDANGGTLTFGVLLGVIDSSLDFPISGNSASFEGPTVGVHVAYAADAFRADLIVKHDALDLEYSVPSLSAEPGRADARSTGASLELGYMLQRTANGTVEAVANLSHVSTRIDSFALGGTDFDFGTSDSTRGAIGLSFRGNYAMGAMNVSPNATVKYWNVFDGGHNSAIDAVAFNYDGTGAYLEATAGLEFVDPDSNISGFVSASGFMGDERTGARAQVGLNLEW
jgi:outer membrane autotransporter protein